MIIGVCMVRDEADVIGTVCAHLLAEGVDRLIVADNLSSDDTRDILEGFGDPVSRRRRPDSPATSQSLQDVTAGP